MAINLDKYRDDLVSAWKDVLDAKTPTNWALFAYEGQTNVLKFVSKGSEGLEELTEDLNSCKIMYAFVKVNDPKTSLDKFVLINWQGEGANTVRKGISANHLRDIEKFFTGAHLTINARNEDEVEPQFIIEKVAKAGSAYSFKAPRAEIIEPSGPVGTTYQRVNPIKEINARERDQFWRKEEEEEKRRIEQERKRREMERLKNEEELRRRELEETAKRDAEMSARNNNIDQIRQAEREASFQAIPPSNREDLENEHVSKVNQSDVLRKQRKQEAEELIAQRTIDARSIFEQNTSAGQVRKTPEKPVRASILKAQNLQVETKPYDSDEETDQFSTIKRSPKDLEKKSVMSPTLAQENVVNQVNNEMKNEVSKELTKEETVQEPVEQITDQQFVDEYIYEFSTPGLQARALYDYQAADDSEITFDPGDIITNIDQVDEGWWQGLAPNGTYGLFPANYVELIQ